MKNIEMTDDVYATLHPLATELHRTPEDILDALLSVPVGSPEAAEPIAALMLTENFRARLTEPDKYIALLSWVSERHAAELGELIRSQSGGGRYLGMTPQEIIETCRRNQARQIDGTQYWAVMNIDTATKSRFLARLLEFIGYRELVIAFACAALGGSAPRRRSWAMALVA